MHNAAPTRDLEADPIDTTLLEQLRIERAQRDVQGNGGLRLGWWIAGAVAALVALGAAAWWFLSAQPITVRTAAVIAARAGAGGGALLQATGYLTARRQATVSTQITGTLTEVLIEAGDTVRKGQVIARLEDSSLRAALNVARAGIVTAEAHVTQAEAQLAQAQAESRRLDELAAAGMIAKQVAEQSRTAVSSADALLAARRSEVQALRSQLAQAQVNFDYTVVRAPFAGVVTAKTAQVGEIVSPLSAGGGFTRTGVCTIVDMDSLEVDVDVNEASIAQVKPDMPAEAVADAYPDMKLPARVIAIVPTADRGKATIRVRVGLERKDPRLVPDMGMRVSFLGSKPSPTPAPEAEGLLVPREALAQRDGRSVVFAVVDGRVQRREVKPAAPKDVGAMRLVTEGVKAGEAVVLAPPADLQDGQSVRTAAP